MRLPTWIIAAAYVLLPAFAAADEQATFNALCLHNGGEYYVQGIDHGLPDNGGGKYFPSFAHWPGKGTGNPVQWPWKIRGWSWTGMQGAEPSPDWVWHTCLARSKDNPYAATMTWPYPLNYALGVVSPLEEPAPLYAGSLPPTAPSAVAGNALVVPSSLGGFDADLNVFAAAGAFWTIASTLPFYGYEFAYLIAPPSSAPSSLPVIEVPSGWSIYQYVWENKGAAGQYLVLSGNEKDCTGALGGNKGKSYSVGGLDGAEAYFFANQGEGSFSEWAMCLLVQDPVTIPVNRCAAADKANPFAAYGFDTGSATVTPLASSGEAFLQLMTSDFANPGTGRFLLAASPWNGPCVPFGPGGNRLPHAFDFFTGFFFGAANIWFHSIHSGYHNGVGGHEAGFLRRRCA